jgi:two-component system NtrC family response regulator
MTEERPTLLIVEDDPGLQRQLKWAFDGYDVQLASNRTEAIAALRRFEPQVILQDLGLPPDADGVEEGFATISQVNELNPRAKIIVVTGRDGREHALRAIASGAFDFCQKPVDKEVLRVIVDRAMRIHALESENTRLRNTSVSSGLPGVIAASSSMVKVCRMIEKLAPTAATVLLLGDSGTGKERLANALHLLSPRSKKSMVAINCAAIPENLLESELFGYERGAFTGAVKQTIGKIEKASGGTLFLDEIGDMPPPLQAKLLRFLQERVIERVGGRDTIPVDVRIVAATNKDLAAAVANGSFREDLYYRLAEISIAIPPLRERGTDGVLIAQALLRAAAARHGRGNLRFSPAALAAIEHHSWPGNVRELENRINRAAIMAEGERVSEEDLGLAIPLRDGENTADFVNLREVRQRAETQAVQRALALAEGNVSRAAELLGVARPTLYDLMERAGVRNEAV